MTSPVTSHDALQKQVVHRITAEHRVVLQQLSDLETALKEKDMDGVNKMVVWYHDELTKVRPV